MSLLDPEEQESLGLIASLLLLLFATGCILAIFLAVWVQLFQAVAG